MKPRGVQAFWVKDWAVASHGTWRGGFSVFLGTGRLVKPCLHAGAFGNRVWGTFFWLHMHLAMMQEKV